MTLSNRIGESRPLRGEEAFVYGLKDRAKRQHCLGYATFSVEFDRLEALRKQYCRQVAPITNVTLFIKAVALAVARHPEANSILFRRRFGPRIVRFERVDVNLPVTRRLDERTVTFIGVIRDAPRKTLAEIQSELSGYQRCDPRQSHAIRRVLAFDGKPLWLARLVHWRMGSSPAFYIRNVGTCGLTLGRGDHEHALPIAPTSTAFAFGGIARTPVARGEEVSVARVMKCTLMIDNFVVRGLVGEELIRDLKRLLESGSFVEAELEAVRKAPVTSAGPPRQAIETGQ